MSSRALPSIPEKKNKYRFVENKALINLLSVKGNQMYHMMYIFYRAWLANVEERRTSVQEVGGSSPRPDQHTRT